ncbi:MAG: YceI family protein [Alphaproteobacteria bacterium]|nr:YceI family protein [Alphaproteobacteria bacterium]MCB9695779.1 YceI family protein [Alphaproteobacteria bacterium]
MLLWTTMLACAPDPGADKPKAEVVEAPAPPAAPAPAPDPGGALTAPTITAPTVLAVDPGRSELGALGAKVTATHPIVFHDFVGAVGMDGDQVTTLSFAVDMRTLEADKPKLTGHLKNEDFFDVEKFPTATFTAVSLAPSTEAGATHQVTGDLTIHGTTKRVAFPATVAVGATEVTASTEFVIDRKDFGVVYPGKPDDLIKDNVVLKVRFTAPRGA